MNVLNSSNLLSYKGVGDGKYLKPKNGTKKAQVLRLVKQKVIQNGVHLEIRNFIPNLGLIKSCDRLVIFKPKVN